MMMVKMGTILTIQILFLDIPLYDNKKVESMPMDNCELYRFDYNPKCGVIVKFYVGTT